jgi:cyclic-di-AMP phosphodiesterase PgpH
MTGNRQVVSRRPSSAALSAALRDAASRSVALGVGLFAAVVLLLVLFPWFPGGQSFEIGQVAERGIVAPRELTYESEVLTERVRQEAVEAVGEVHVLNTEVRDTQTAELERILGEIQQARGDETLSASARETAIAGIDGTDLSQRSAATLATASTQRWQFMVNEALNALTRTLTSAIGEDEVQGARNRAAGFLSAQLSTDETLALTELLDPLIRPTLVVDADRTAALRAEALANAPVVHATYTRGDVIVEQGAVIDDAAFEAIERMAIQPSAFDLRLILASALAAVLAGAAIGGHVWVMRPRALRGVRRLLLLVLLLVVPVALAKFSMPVLLPDEQRYFIAQALPLAAGPIVAAVLLDVPSGVLLSVLIAGLVGFTTVYLPSTETGAAIAQLDSMRLVLSTLAGSLAGVYVAARADRLQAYMATGFAVGLASAVAMLIILLVDPARAWRDVPWLLGTAFGGGLLTAVLAVGAFVLLSRPFGIITRVELMELVQLNHPVLRRLQDEAPGTFQHSMLVGNLAERAADRIGADSLLVRVGAYYHDIGKLVAPSFFVENFGESDNPHEHLDPLQSTRVIHQHVTAGIELARKEGLPEAVAQFIPQHHGTRLVAFFYRRAAEQNPDVDPELFRYPGPRPQSRETALVMIADACEASVRASTDRSAERIRQIVEDTIRERVEEGEFDECDLSMRDLRVVADTYSTTLIAVFHPRVEYPEPTRQELAARSGRRRRSSDDGPPAPPPAATTEDVATPPPPRSAEPAPRSAPASSAPPRRRPPPPADDADADTQPPARPRSRQARPVEPDDDRHELSEDST